MKHDERLQKLVSDFVLNVKLDLGLNLSAYSCAEVLTFYGVLKDCIYDVAKNENVDVKITEHFGASCEIRAGRGIIILYEGQDPRRQAEEMLAESREPTRNLWPLQIKVPEQIGTL